MKLPVAILAGGLATRLRPLTDKIPKSLLPVAGKPFGVHQIELLASHGFDHLVFCVGYQGEQIVEAFGNGRRWNVTIDYCFDGAVPLGTGGALKNALPHLGKAFLILYGDSYLGCDYAGIADTFLKSGRRGLMTVFRNANRFDKSNVLFFNGRIKRYDKINGIPEMQHIDYGLGALQSQVFDDYEDNQPLDLATVYQDLIIANELAGVEVTTRFYEIGSPAGLEETEKYLLSKQASSQGDFGGAR